ncbi:MAG: PEP-CTERM sorting domain-containing protein [Bryobacteraceae bacterium]
MADRIANADGVRNTVLGGMSFTILEDFEGYSALYNGPSIATGVGTFTAGGLSGQGSCLPSVPCTDLYILDAATTPFSGRYNTTAGGSKWLDSNDVTFITLNLEAPNLNSRLNNLFFFITDVEDQGGQLTVTANDGQSVIAHFGGSGDNAKLVNGSLFFVNINSAAGLSSITFSNTSRKDGFGVDDFGTVVPEPGSIALLGAGLVAVGLYRRKQRRA